MKMGTFSENLIRKLGKDVGVLLDDNDRKWHDAALYAINQMSGKGEWGIIHEPWFEKVNNVSALIGFAAGVATIGVIAGMKKLVSEDEEKES